MFRKDLGRVGQIRQGGPQLLIKDRPSVTVVESFIGVNVGPEGKDVSSVVR